MDDEETIIGKKIIEKIGLPLINGYPKRLGSDALWLKRKSLTKTATARKKEFIEFIGVYEKISYHSQELERLLKEIDFFHGAAPWRLPMLEILDEIGRLYPFENKISSDEINFEPLDINKEIADLYEKYFGKKPAYTWSELNGYVGPFWEFVRALRDCVGMDISEAAIRKANQRSKKETN